MIATRRLGWSHALDRCVELCHQLGKPLLVLEPLSVGYRWASDRHHGFILDGMAEHDRTLTGSPVGYYPYIEPGPGAGRGLLAALAAHACVVITDDVPTFVAPRLVESGGPKLPCRLEAVDSCGVLPMRAAGRVFSAAYHFRRHLQKVVPLHLSAPPAPDPFSGAPIRPFPGVPAEILDQWPRADPDLLSGRTPLSALPIDHEVGPTDLRGGGAEARRRLDAFLRDDLARYAEERNDPDADVVSGLSPYLHHGHISAHEIFEAIAAREGWSPARINEPANGRRSGWWGMSDSSEAFLDQLLTWRELGYGWCGHDPDHASYRTLPEWARVTLTAHASDDRPYLYTPEELDGASTHDALWNAAQRQLVMSGTIHGYLRMLWGKKILEWTADPRDAFTLMVELNDRYALDGRDPNSYSGIAWVLGKFDRGWPERPVYGKVRSMSSDRTRRKVSIDGYLERWGGKPR